MAVPLSISLLVVFNVIPAINISTFLFLLNSRSFVRTVFSLFINPAYLFSFSTSLYHYNYIKKYFPGFLADTWWCRLVLVRRDDSSWDSGAFVVHVSKNVERKRKREWVERKRKKEWGAKWACWGIANAEHRTALPHYDAKMARRRHPRISRSTRHWPAGKTTPSVTTDCCIHCILRIWAQHANTKDRESQLKRRFLKLRERAKQKEQKDWYTERATEKDIEVAALVCRATTGETYVYIYVYVYICREMPGDLLGNHSMLH